LVQPRASGGAGKKLANQLRHLSVQIFALDGAIVDAGLAIRHQFATDNQ
jgi:hypothetical protein